MPETPQTAENETVELNELFTFIGEKKNKKNKAYILTAVDRQTRCIVGWQVVWERQPIAMQQVVD